MQALRKLTAHSLVTRMCRLFIKPFPDGSCRLLHSPVSAAAFTPGELNPSQLCSDCWENVVWLIHVKQMVNQFQNVMYTECTTPWLKWTHVIMLCEYTILFLSNDSSFQWLISRSHLASVISTGYVQCNTYNIMVLCYQCLQFVINLRWTKI